MEEIRILPDYFSLASYGAEKFTALAEGSMKERNKFTVALAGGSTPRGMYRLLALKDFSDRIDWPHVEVFWSDERCVPQQDPESNYKMAMETFLSSVPIPPENIHRMASEHPPHQAAEEYADTLREVFGLTYRELPRFDLILLGMGQDGHTASLFPGTPVVKEKEQWVAALYVEKLCSHRITLTAPVLKNAQNAIFMVSGGDKAETLKKVLENHFQPLKYPAQLLHYSRTHVLWLIDEAAASKLK